MSFQCSTELEYKAVTNNGLKNIQTAYCENQDSSYTGAECIFKKAVVECFVVFTKKKQKNKLNNPPKKPMLIDKKRTVNLNSQRINTPSRERLIKRTIKNEAILNS